MTVAGPGSSDNDAAGDDSRFQQALATLKSGIDLGFGGETLDGWRDREPAHLEVFRDVQFGEIVWEKSLGRPESPTLAEAFEITASGYQEVMDQKGDQQIPTILTPPRPVSAFDGPDEPGRWRVLFLVGATPVGAVVLIKCKLRPEVGWPLRAGPFSPTRFPAVEPPSLKLERSPESGIARFEAVGRLVPPG